MSHSKIAKLVAEVSKELQIDIPDVDRMTIMQEVRNLVKTNHPVPELMNSESETEQESDIEFVGVTENKDEESSVSDVIEILSDEKSTDSPLSVGQDVTPVNDGVNDGEEMENDSSDVIEMENCNAQTTSDCEYEETVDDSPVIFADDQNRDEMEDSGTFHKQTWRDLRRKFSRKNPWVTRKRRKKKTELIYSVLKKAKNSLKSCNTDVEIPKPIVMFKRTWDEKKPWELQTISPESYMEQKKSVDSSLKHLESIACPDTRSVTKKLSSIDAETIMESCLEGKASVKMKTCDIIKESMKKYPGVIIKDVKVSLNDCITDTNRYKLLLNYIKEQQLRESKACGPDIQDECKNGLFFKCGVALKDRFTHNWNRNHNTPEPIRIGPKVNGLELQTDRLASLSYQSAATEKEKFELEWIGTDPSKGFSNLLVHNDFARDRDVKLQSFDGFENTRAEMDWNNKSISTELSSDIKPSIENLHDQTMPITDSSDSDESGKKRGQLELDPITGELTRGQPVLDPITGELTFEEFLDTVKEEPMDESDNEIQMKTKNLDDAKEIENDKSGCTSEVNFEGNELDKNKPTLPNSNSEILDAEFKFPGAELIYTCTTTEGVLPIEQIESAINKDIESRRAAEDTDTNWKQLKSTLAERVYRIEKLMGTISEENKDGEVDHFKHYALQKARAELNSVKDQAGLIRDVEAAKLMPTMGTSIESTDDEASSDSNFSVSNLIATDDEEEVLKAEERGLKRKRPDSKKSSKRVILENKRNYFKEAVPSTCTNEVTADEAVAVDFNMDEEFVYLREVNPIHPAKKPIKDVKFLGKFDMLIRRELYKTMLAPNLSHDDFDKAMASIMGVPMEIAVLDVIEEKMNHLKVKLRQCWMNLIKVKNFGKNNADLVKKSRIQAKSLEYLRGRIYDNLKPCILKTYSYQTICRMILICLSEILDRDKHEIIELYHQELQVIHAQEEQRKKRELFSSQFEDIQAREAIRLRQINMQETELAKQKKKEAERQAELEEERKRKAEEPPVVIDLVEEDDETNKKASNPGPSKPMDDASIKLVHDMLLKKMQSGAGKEFEGTYSRGRGTRRRRSYRKGQSWVNPLGKDMSKVRIKPSPETTIYPPSTDLQRRCPMLFFKLQQHVQTSLERSTGALLSNAVRESLAYRIASSYALEHKEELKSLEQMVQRKQATSISTEVKEGLDFIIEQNIDDDEDEDENQKTVPNIKQSSSPPPVSSGCQEWTQNQEPSTSMILVKHEPVESEAITAAAQSAVNQPIPAITDCVAPVSAPIQFFPRSSVDLSSPIRPTSPLDSQSAVKTALLNRLMAGLPKVRVPLPPGWPFVTTSIPELTKAALVDKLRRNIAPYQTSTTLTTSDGGSAAVRIPRVSHPFSANARIRQPSVVAPAATVYVPQSVQTQLSTVTSALPQGTGTILVDATMPPVVVDATVPPAAQTPLNIKQIAKQNQQAAVQPIALQPAYISGSGEQLFVPVFPSENTDSASGTISPTVSVAPVLTQLQLTTSTSETGTEKPLGKLYPKGQYYERTPTPPPLDSSVPVTPNQPSPFLKHIRPAALSGASPNLLQAIPPGVTSPFLQTQTVRPVRAPFPAALPGALSSPLVTPVGTPFSAAVTGASSSPLVRPGNTPSPLTRPVSPHSSQFCQLPIPSMQLADFLAMQLRAQIEAANKIAEDERPGSLNLPFMNNNEEIMAALNAPILKAMDSPLLAALNSTVIKALEGSLGRAPPPYQNPPPNEKAMTSAIDSQSPPTGSQSSTISQQVTSQPLVMSQSGLPVVSNQTAATEDKTTPVESAVTSETTSSCTISSVLTSVVSTLKTISTTIASEPLVLDTPKDTSKTESLSSDTSIKGIEIVEDDTAIPAIASTASTVTIQSIEKSATENKGIPDDVEDKSDKEETYEVYTYAEPNNSKAIAKVLDFLESNTQDGKVDAVKEPNVTELKSNETGTSISNADDTSDKRTTSCLYVSDDSSRDSDSGVLEIALEEPENDADQDIERYLSIGDTVTEDTATASESEQASVCTIVSYGSLAPSETVTDSKEKDKSVKSVGISSQGTTLRDLLTKPSVSKSPSVNPSLVNPIKFLDVSTTSSKNVSTKGSLSTSTPPSSPPSLTKPASSFSATTPSLGDLLSKTATVGSSTAPSSTITSSADDSSTTSDSSWPAFTTVRIPPGYLASPLDGAFRVTLPDETINKIIEDAIKSVGTALTPKAQAMVRSQLDRISVPKEILNDMKPGVMGDIAKAVVHSTTDTTSSGQSDVEITDGNLASSGTRRRNDPFFKLPLSGVRPIRNVADDGTVSWTCTLCGKNFTRNFTYRRHAETHMNIKPWKCEICSKAFSDKRYLEKHMRWHTGQDLQYCEECGRAFSDELALSKHKRVHDIDKKYPCEKNPCQKVFADPHSLKRHIMHVHDQKKTHKCELCNLMFVFKSHLDDHMKRHTGEKPHRCSICGKGFIQVGTRNRHEKQHKGGKAGEPYKCAICMNIFWFKEELRSHFYSMHPDVPVPEAHRKIFMEFDEVAQHEDVSEEETRIRVAHIPRERYPITSGEEDSDTGPVPVAIASDLVPPELPLAVDDDFIPDALAPNQQVPVLLNETEPFPEIEAKGKIKDLIAATVEPMDYDTTVEPVICNVETVTDPDTKEHLRELVRQQEEKDRLASEAVIRPSKQEEEKDRQASDVVVRLSKQQEEKDRYLNLNLNSLLVKHQSDNLRDLVRQQAEKDRLASEAVIRPSNEEVEKDRHASETVVRLSKQQEEKDKHLRDLVRQQEEKDRLASEAVIRPSNEEVEKDRHASDVVVRLSKKQEEKDRLAREEVIRLSKLLYKIDTESNMQRAINRSNFDSNSVFDQTKSKSLDKSSSGNAVLDQSKSKSPDKSSSENASHFQIQVKTEPIEAELSVNTCGKEMESGRNENQAVKQYLGNLMKAQTAASSQSRITDSAEQNTGQSQSVPNIKDISKVPNIKDISKVPNIKDISKGIHSQEEQSTWLQTKTKLKAQTDKIESLMELFREKGVPKEETASGDDESEDSD